MSTNVPADKSKIWIQAMLDDGMHYTKIAELAGLSNEVIKVLARNGRDTVRDTTEHKILLAYNSFIRDNDEY